MRGLKSTCVGLCLCLAVSISPGAQGKRPHGTSNSCREFVGEFYIWYLGIALKNSPSRTSDLALKSKPYLFSPDLVQQLRADSDAQEKAGSDFVSLDADAFLGTDGPFERYIVEKIAAKNGKCWAQVHGVLNGKESELPNVTPELEFKNGRWIFVNFYFPSPSDPKAWNLLGALKADRESLKEYGAKKSKKP